MSRFRFPRSDGKLASGTSLPSLGIIDNQVGKFPPLFVYRRKEKGEGQGERKPKKRVNKRRLVSRGDQLRRMILTGKLKKGDRLKQEKIALRFNVSRTSVIWALYRLKEEGLITSRQKGSGWVVK